jgi:hypothetical protein
MILILTPSQYSTSRLSNKRVKNIGSAMTAMGDGMLRVAALTAGIMATVPRITCYPSTTPCYVLTYQ